MRKTAMRKYIGGATWVRPLVPSELPSSIRPPSSVSSLPTLDMVHTQSGSDFAASDEDEAVEEIEAPRKPATKRKKNVAG